jgi:hypothetical protein
MLSDINFSQVTYSPENSGIQWKIIEKVDHLQYCGGAKQLDNILQTLISNIAAQQYLFPRGYPDQGKNAVCSLDIWNNLPDPTQQQMDNTDPSKLAGHLRDTKEPCVGNLKLFTNRLQMIY